VAPQGGGHIIIPKKKSQHLEVFEKVALALWGKKKFARTIIFKK